MQPDNPFEIKDSQKMVAWEELVSKYKLQITAGLIGLILVLLGFIFLRLGKSGGSVEILESSSSSVLGSTVELIVEVSGEVNKPGVYKLEPGSRVDDALSLAGGVTEQADSNFLGKIINRAAKLTDGQKIYIPSSQDGVHQSEDVSANILGMGSGHQNISTNVSKSSVNINTASKSQLEALWGIGPVIAQNIIEQRPYSDVKELLDKKIIKSNVWERIKDEISVY